jgi:uroporphyrinogen-III decarboxylase
MNMTGRQRLIAALQGEPTDRVPISTYELVGHNSVSWENREPSYARLMDAIRTLTDCICMWNPRSNATVFDSSHPVELHAETSREGDFDVTRWSIDMPRGRLTRTTKVSDNVHTVWQTEHWCKSLEDVDAALSVPYEPLQFDHGDLARVRGEVGENGIIMASLADPLWMAADLMEFSDYTMWAMTETEHFARTVAVMHERNMENLRRMLDDGVVDLYRICGPEYATPPFLPPEFFERFVVPCVTQMTELIHSMGGLVRLHCHGKIAHVLDMILATEPDGIDPCEAPPDGDIDLRDIKRRVGSRACLFGNLQLKLLESGSGEQVEDAVQGCMAAAKADGRYVIMPTAAPINVPLSPKTEGNYLRFIETALRLGEY